MPFPLTYSDWMQYYYLKNDFDHISCVHKYAPFTRAACLGMSINAHLLHYIYEEYFYSASSFLIIMIYHIWCTVVL